MSTTNFIELEQKERQILKEIIELLDEKSFHKSRMGVIDTSVGFLKFKLKEVREHQLEMMEKDDKSKAELRDIAVIEQIKNLGESGTQ